MDIKRHSVACIVAVFAVSAATALRAGEITGVSWFSGVASVAGTVFAPPVSPNNDNNVLDTSPNEIFVTQKDYVGIGPVDLMFDVVDSGGVTEYVVVEGVQNNTGLDWTGYHIELGFGEGADFEKSPSGDGLDFDAPDYDSDFFFNPSPGFFPDVLVTEDDVIADGGVMADFDWAGYFVFHVDVPDDISSFTIRQSPIAVAEPSTLGLLAVGGIGLLIRRRRGRKA